MATKLFEDPALTGAEPGFSTMEYSAVRKVIRDHIRNATKSNKNTAAIIEEHASSMRELLGSYDYEAINLPMIIKNSSEMDIQELEKYLKTIESLAVCYSGLFGKELAFLLVSGMLAKFHNSVGLNSHYAKLVGKIEEKMMYYKGKANAESRVITVLNYSIKEMESGIFWVFRKKKIRGARTRMNRSEARLKTINSKMGRLTDILESTRHILPERHD